MTKTMTKSLRLAVMALGLAITAPVTAYAAGGGEHHIEKQAWTFGGFRGQYDAQQLQRGFQVYKEVCAACHGLSRVAFRSLAEPGGPLFPEEAVKALAAEWPNQIAEKTEAGESAVVVKDKDGKVTGFKYATRPARLADPILGPYKNEAEARAAQNGALPPDLSLITRARNVHNTAPWYKHVFLMMRDIAIGYQEGGADYLYALMTGYHEAPKTVTVAEGMNYNTAFPGNQIAMPNVLDGGPVTYGENAGAKASQQQNARDVAAFLSWAADPSLDQRKRIGWQVMLYLLITTVLLFIGKRRIWAKMH